MPKRGEIPRLVKLTNGDIKGCCPKFLNNENPPIFDLDRQDYLLADCLRPRLTKEVRIERVLGENGVDTVNPGSTAQFIVTCNGCVCNLGKDRIIINQWTQKVDLMVQPATTLYSR